MALEPLQAWTRLLGSTSDDFAMSVTTGSDGSIYIAGSTSGNLDGNSNSGGRNAFLSKYNGNGSKAWTRLLGAASSNYAESVTTGSDGSIYIAGSTQGDLDGNIISGYTDAFLSKYNSDGSKAWTRTLGSASSDYARSVTTGSDGSIYITGSTSGKLDGNTIAGYTDAFLSKYNSDGSKAWTRLLSSTSGESADSVTTGSDGSIYIAGTTQGNLDGNTNAGGSDAFLSKYNSDGGKAWTRLLGSASTDSASSVTTGSDGSIYIAGFTSGNLDGNTNTIDGYTDAFLSKYNSDGSKAWTRTLGSASSDYARSVTTGSDGSIYIAGYTYGNLDGNTNAGGTDAFLSKYNIDGFKAWTRILGSASSDNASSVTTGSDGSIFIAGSTSGNLDGNTIAGSTDAFLTKYTLGSAIPFTPPVVPIPPLITLSVSPASVEEDGSLNLLYTFRRFEATPSLDLTGPTSGSNSAALTVNYTQSGTATLATDYNGVYVVVSSTGTGSTRSTTFAAGSATAFLLIDPAADTTSEADETVTITLASGTGYTVGTATAVVGTIINDDSLTSSYLITPSVVTVNEADMLTTMVVTTNVASGTTLYWSVGGIGVTAADFLSGSLTGTGTVGTDGKFSFAHLAANDLATEGDETLQIKLFTDSARTVQVGSIASVTIKDTSVPVVRGNSLYTIVDGPSWTQAEANSVKLGGHLTAITSKEENEFLFDSFIKGKKNYYWMGFTDKVVEGDWKWVNGDSVDYTNWYPGMPDDDQRVGGQDYAKIGWYTPYLWDDTSDVPSNGELDLKGGIAETPFIRRGDSAYVIVQGPTWEEAEANAVKLGGHLVESETNEETDFLRRTFYPSDNSSERRVFWQGKVVGGLQNDSKWNGIGGSYVWDLIGGIKEPTERTVNPGETFVSKYQYGLAEIQLAPNNPLTGTPTLSGTFKAGQVVTIDSTPIQDADNFTGYTPTFNYSFEVSNDNGTNWTKLTSTDETDNNTTYTLTTAEVGKQVRGVVSYLDGYGTNESVASTGSSVISAPVVRGNSLYTIVDGPSWTQAEANSVKLGGHLVTINDKFENAFVSTLFGSEPQSVHWLGLARDSYASSWKWISGQSQNYVNWDIGEPNSFQSEPQNYAHTWTSQDWLLSNGIRAKGTWNDTFLNSQLVVQGIAETPFIRRGDSAYVIVQGPTWEEAEANAVILGGHLVTINDAAENEWISNQNWKENGKSIWIGATDKDVEGAWKWADGSKFDYSNWGNAAPNGGVVNEDYAQIPFGGEWNGKVWNDDYNGDTRFGFVTNYGIAEIKLAPNNTPTGTPTLSGTFKSGQDITIDKTPVQDADNFTGYTPTFNYSFEVSGDNGTTWTKITSTDASDNNSTYTLTSAEAGKKLRGVMSYLDGYGTQESVASAGFSVASAPVVRGNSLYTFVDGPSWTEAEANSVKLGGHLAAITSAGENDFLFNQFMVPRWTNRAEDCLWIGLTDALQEGTYAWSSGESVSYLNLNPYVTDPQYGITTQGIESKQDWVLFYNLETNWDTQEILGYPLTGRSGIAETSFIRRGDSVYVIVQGPTWEEAEANAVKLGGHLVTINDAAENEWITANLSGKNLYYPASDGSDYFRDAYWTGFRRNGNSFYWVDGSPFNYSKFGSGEPAFNGDYGEITLRSKAGDWASQAGNWNDESNNPHYGIAEIKLAPNNGPTGTPVLSGTLKAGQVITIDRTPLQDADNFTGYTPTFNYSYEVSNDNGTTWTKLTTTDATDNNSTYTLTTAEVGKQVRGVVSYLDGYGTNESVASAASSNVIAPSNISPTAFQTLTGSSKVGRVLTADKSTIVDPDGVPTSLSYGWEVSTNGTTWTKLTSADATDNNSTYALTGAELGKTVRSVISYTDEPGTNETVSSAPASVVLAGAKPTGISLSKSTFAENVGPNVAVVKLSSADLDIDDAYTYSLVAGSGSTDNSRFSIAGDQLVITGNPDFETKNSYSIRVRTTDLGGLTVDKSFTLKVTNVNEAPIAISLSDSDFLENIAAGSVIGNLSSLDPDKETTFTYSLTPNSPRATFADNQFFSIVNDQLKINASENFEQKDSFSISVRSTDSGKLFYDQIFTLVVQDVDEAPTDISITGTGIDEGAAVGSIVGSLVSTDQDESSTDFTYALVAGTKPNNNDQFEIVGDQLKAKATFNFETKSSYVVNVRTTDEAGLTFTKSITIKVNNVNENPTDLTVSATAFNENVAPGTTIATLGVLDPDKSDTYSYSFVFGEGDKDNQAFLIAGNALKVNIPTNFEVQKSYAVRLRVTDQGGLFIDKAVSLGVINQVEKVASSVSTILAPDKDTLELTGSKNVFGIGNQFDNTIIGNSGKNKLTGGMGKDILTGGAGVDTFFYNDLKESLLSGFDVITDYTSVEKINLGVSSFEGDDLIASTGKASALNAGAIGAVLTNTTFLANNAAAFTVEGFRGTFLAFNDGRDGFQADSDALIHLSNYTIGSKTPISII